VKRGEERALVFRHAQSMPGFPPVRQLRCRPSGRPFIPGLKAGELWPAIRKKLGMADHIPNDNLVQFSKDCSDLPAHLSKRALSTSGFGYLCTSLRVEGMTAGHWDVFLEAEDAAHDFSDLLRLVEKAGSRRQVTRMKLLLYCHLTEMSAPYEILTNLLRCCQGKPYLVDPFSHLEHPHGKPPFLAKRNILGTL